MFEIVTTLTYTGIYGNTHGMFSYANVTCEPSRKALNFCSLFTLRVNRITVVVPVESIRALSERFANTAYGFFLGKRVAYLVVSFWERFTSSTGLFSFQFSSMDGLNGRSSYNRAMIELQANVELKDTTVVAMPKLSRQGFYRCNEECPKNPDLGAVKNLKSLANTSKSEELEKPPRGVPFGTNGGTSNLASNGANSSGSSFWNVETSSTRTTPIVDRIGKIEKLIIDGKLTLGDNDCNPLKKVDYSGDHDREDE
ncbi:hypothetical protein Tco_1246718, partial [Tanacetum coccineum]